MLTKKQRGQVSLGTGVVIAIIILGLVLLFSCMRTVDVSESCAWVRLGKVLGEAKPGFQLTNPLNAKVCYPGQSVLFQTVQDSNGDGKITDKDTSADYADFPVEIKTGDGQTAYVEFNLIWHVEPACASTIRSSIASDTNKLVIRVINSFSRSIPRDLAPNYTAQQLYGIMRINFEADILAAIEPKFTENCVVLDELILRDINFDPAFEDVMEQKQIQQEQITVEEYIADQAVQKKRATITNAEADAAAAIEQAKGNAEKIRLTAIAEAEAMRVKGIVLRDYPEMLSLQYFETLKSVNWSLVPWDSMNGYLPVMP